MSDALGPRLDPCGPVVDPVAAERTLERLSEAARQDGWSDALQAAWPALAPAFSASPLRRFSKSSSYSGCFAIIVSIVR